MRDLAESIVKCFEKKGRAEGILKKMGALATKRKKKLKKSGTSNNKKVK